ncbi:MAG: S8 family peptidase [Clostridiales bacterium]|nr:S8 family peptidase [Clostridiales bacterium]
MDRVRRIIRANQAYRRGYYGEGVGVAVLDTGIFLHQDFEKRVVCFRDYINGRTKPYDDNGHGTHIAGIIGGNGSISGGKYMGIAPKAHFIVVKILDQKGNGNTENVVESIRWLVAEKEKYKIRIVNISIGMVLEAESSERRRLLQAVDYAWDNGIVVVAAAGNNGPGENSVTVPGISRKIITVGCCDDTKEQIGVSRLKPDYSGQGPTDHCIVKPELVVPGTNIISCSITGEYVKKSGTSMAAPIVSGCVAILLSKYPRFSPAEVKLRLYERALDLGMVPSKQGWGMVDIGRLL